MSEVARDARIGLCLKHFPGIGGARVDSHQDFIDISDALSADQEALFYSPAPKMFGNAVLVSHAIVRQKSGAILQAALHDVFPELRAVRIDYCWGGMVDSCEVCSAAAKASLRGVGKPSICCVGL
jgi:glycine/D-amino acid oxidase-like deaminating enzyme